MFDAISCHVIFDYEYQHKIKEIYIIIVKVLWYGIICVLIRNHSALIDRRFSFIIGLIPLLKHKKIVSSSLLIVIFLSGTERKFFLNIMFNIDQWFQIDLGPCSTFVFLKFWCLPLKYVILTYSRFY